MHVFSGLGAVVLVKAGQAGYGGYDEGGIADGGQRDEVDAMSEDGKYFGCDPQAEACFADATCAGECQKPDIGTLQEDGEVLYFLLAPNEWGELYREVMLHGWGPLGMCGLCLPSDSVRFWR